MDHPLTPSHRAALALSADAVAFAVANVTALIDIPLGQSTHDALRRCGSDLGVLHRLPQPFAGFVIATLLAILRALAEDHPERVRQIAQAVGLLAQEHAR